MPEPIAFDRDEFLRRIADRLPFGEAERRDVIAELEAHLSDSTARLEADGLPRDAAERTAIERLGRPERLADSLAEARRSPRRLFAAAGAGTYAALGGVLYGYFFALLVVMGISMATVLLAAGPLHLFGDSWASLLDTTSMTVAALAVGAYVAGRKLTTTAAARAGYRIELARRITAVVGGGVVLAWVLFIWRGALTWPEVGMLLSLPAWFVLGAWRATRAPFPSRRWRLGVVGLALVFVPVALLLGIGQQSNASGGGTFHPAGAEKIGLPRPLTIEAAITENGGPSPSGPTWLTVDDPAVLAGWSGFRVEAWRGITNGEVDYGPDWAVDPGATAPFAIGAANLLLGPGSFNPGSFSGTTAGQIADGSATVVGAVTINNVPDVTLAWVAITGLGPDGRRYVLEGPAFMSTAFNGTVADWLIAVISGR